MKQRILACLLSLTMALGTIPSAVAAELIVDDTPSTNIAVDRSVATVGVTDTEAGQFHTQAAGDSDVDFGSQLRDDPVATQAYEELEQAFAKEEYTCSNSTVTIEYNSKSNQVVGTTPDYKATDEEIEDMMKDFHRSIRNAYAAFCKDHPEVFFLGNTIEQTETLTSALSDGQYQWKVKSVTVTMESLFSSKRALNTAKTRYASAMASAVAYAKEGTSRYQQLLRAHNYICEKTTYTTGAYAHSAYGALVDGSSVCDGYAMAFKAVCDQLDIPCVEVSGTGISANSTESHMWNLVQMENGKWYGVDATWDDHSDTIYTTYFLVGSKTTAKADFGLGAFSETHVPSGYFYDDTETKEYAYPKQSGSRYVPATKLEMERSASTDIHYSVQLDAELTPSNASCPTIAWSSSDEEVATVDDSGLVTGKGEGEAVITASCADGITAQCTVTVSRVAVESISLPETTAVSCSRTVQLTSKILPERATNQEVTWESADEEVATVDDSGLITGVGEGTTEITVRAENDISATTKVTVAYVKPEKINLSKTSAEVYLDDTLELKATIIPENVSNPELTWSSSDESIAAVNEDGLVTAKGEGTARITATAEDGVSASCTVTVRPIPVEQVTLDQTSLQLYEKETQSLTAEVTPKKATHREVTWKSSNTDAATVDEEGAITAVRAGKTTITATADGVSATCAVQVVPHLNQPELVSAVNATKGVRITWKPVDGATGYMVCRKQSGSWARTQLASVSGAETTSYLDKTSKAGGIYLYTVYAMYGTCKASSFDTTGMSLTVIPTPKLSKISNKRTGMQIEWKKVAVADGYYVYRRAESEAKWTMICDVKSEDTLTYTDSTAENRVTYQYTVRAYVGSNLSAYHAAGLVLRRVKTPEIKSVKNSGRGKLTASWSRVGYVSGYQIEYARKSDFSNSKLITIAENDTVSYKIGGLTKGKNYYVRVRAYKTQKGNRINSSWSTRKRVTIKK